MLKTAQNQVTVIILPLDPIHSEQSNINEPYRGIIYPSQKGSIAIVGKTIAPRASVR